jgi:hypothetical protein
MYLRMSLGSLGCNRWDDHGVVSCRGISYDTGLKIRFTEPEQILNIVTVGFLRKEQLVSLWLGWCLVSLLRAAAVLLLAG